MPPRTGSPEILKELQKDAPIPFKLELFQENRGTPVALNRCLALAEGELVSLCASDDMHFPAGMEKMVEVLQKDERVQVVYGNGRIMESETLTDKEMFNDRSLAFLNDTPKGALKRLQAGDFPMWFQCGISRAAMVRTVGGWNEKLKADDGQRARRVYMYLAENDLKHAHIDVPYYIYRTHETNLHKDVAKMREHLLEVMEANISVEERPQYFVRSLVRVMRVSLENGKVREAVQTLKHLLEDADDPQLDTFLGMRLMTFVNECTDAQRDPASDQWSCAAPPLQERVREQKEKIAEQRQRIEGYRAQIDAQKEELRGLKRSASWKIGRMLTKPFRLLNNRRERYDK